MDVTFGERRRLGRVRQAELALLPAAVVVDQRVVRLLDVHVVSDTEHVAGSLNTEQHKHYTLNYRDYRGYRGYSPLAVMYSL